MYYVSGVIKVREVPYAAQKYLIINNSCYNNFHPPNIDDESHELLIHPLKLLLHLVSFESATSTFSNLKLSHGRMIRVNVCRYILNPLAVEMFKNLSLGFLRNQCVTYLSKYLYSSSASLPVAGTLTGQQRLPMGTGILVTHLHDDDSFCCYYHSSLLCVLLFCFVLFLLAALGTDLQSTA